MPVYTVRIQYEFSENIEVEADDEDTAIDRAYKMDPLNGHNVTSSLEIISHEVKLCDSQYSDHRELLDREREHGL